MKAIMTPDEVAADREAWLEVRRGGIGASEIAKVLALCPRTWGSPRSLWDEKASGLERRDAGQMKRGRKLEPLALEEFAEAYPEIGLNLGGGGLYCHDDRPWQLATFDALADGQPVQVKTSPLGIEYRDGLPDYYRAQAMWELDVAEAQVVWVPVLVLESWKIQYLFKVERTDEVEADLAFMRTEAWRFLMSLAQGEQPEVDWGPACREMLITLNPPDEDAVPVRVPQALARRRVRAHQAVRRAERRLALADNQLRERMGGARRAVARNPRTGKDETVVTRVTSTVSAHWRNESTRDYLKAGKWDDREEQD